MLNKSDITVHNIKILEKYLLDINSNTNVETLVEKIQESFDSVFYLSTYSDVAQANLDPLAHFLAYGIYEGRNPNHAFDFKYYEQTYGHLLSENNIPYFYYLLSGQQAGHYGNALEEKIDNNTISLALQKKFNNLDFLKIFDHEYYNALHLNKSFKNPWVGALSHFAEVGYDQQLNINKNWEFDVVFYLAQYTSEFDINIARSDLLVEWIKPSNTSNYKILNKTAYEHFISKGYQAGHLPNLARLAEKQYNINLQDYEVKLLMKHIIPILAIKELSDPAGYLEKIFNNDNVNFIYSFNIDQIDSNLANLLLKLANHHASKGRDQSAELIYGFLKLSSNNNTSRYYGEDTLQRLNCKGAAYARRVKKASEGTKNDWTFIHIANHLRDSGASLQAIEAYSTAAKKVPDSFHIQKLYKEEGEKLFMDLWQEAPSKAKYLGIDKAQRDLTTALDNLYPVTELGSPRREIKSVAIVALTDLAQCTFYRVKQKVEHLKTADFEVEVFPYISGILEFQKRINQFDAVIFYRVPAFPNVCKAINLSRISGLHTFYELDDQIFQEGVFPPPYETYANAISYDQYLEIAMGVPLFKKAMNLCEFGIASTPKIQKSMEKIVQSGKVFLHRNGLSSTHNFAIEDASKNSKVKKEYVEIFYGSGTKAHKEVLYKIIAPVFNELVEEFGHKVRFRLIGHIDKDHEALKKISDSITVLEPTWDIEEYWDMLCTSDINIAVLEKSTITDGKSEIKWLEAAMFGIPSVVSPTQTYTEILKDGENVMFARTKEEFLISLRKLITNNSLRRNIGENAKKTATDKYSVDKLAKNITSIMTSAKGNKPVKKRLLVVNVFYAPQSIGGATRVVEDNIKELKEKYGDSYEIEVITTNLGGDEPYKVHPYIINGVRVHAISTPKYNDIDQAPTDSKMEDVFNNLLDIIDPKLVHFHCIQRLTASIVTATRQRKIPYVITLHDGWWLSPNQFLIDSQDQVELYDYNQPLDILPARARALKKSLFSAKRLLPVSESFAEIAKSCGLINIETIENGVSTLEKLPHEESPDGRVRLAHIGGNSRHKGVHLVKHALLSYDFKNLHLTLIDHSFKPNDEILTYWGSTPVTIRGKYSSSEISKLYSKIDILLAPSIWPESYGLVTREALISGRWAIASNIGAIASDITNEKNGYIIAPSDHLGLRKALMKIDESPKRHLKPPRTKLKLRKSADQAKDLMSLYEKLIS